MHFYMFIAVSHAKSFHFRRQHRVDSDIRAIIHQQPTNKKATSNQINQARRKNQTDYENLLLLQKIQNAKPSNTIYKSFGRRF